MIKETKIFLIININTLIDYSSMFIIIKLEAHQ